MDLPVRPEREGIPGRDIEREHRVRAFSFSGLRDLLRDYGVEHGPILEEAGLAAKEIDDGLAFSLEKLAKALTVGARVTGDLHFGLKHEAKGRFTSNPIGYLMANAPDLRTGL